MSKRAQILVVDDEPINVQVISSALKHEYDVITALNGGDALSLVHEQRPDLILLDVMMPELSGFEVCLRLKENPEYNEIPIIFVTAFDSVEGEIEGLGLGAIDYITKPVNFDQLKLRVRNQVVLKERNDRVRAERDTLKEQHEKLEETFLRAKKLEGVIPICMYCKKIRDKENIWNQLEQYITEHSDILFSHGICPGCLDLAKTRLSNMKTS